MSRTAARSSHAATVALVATAACAALALAACAEEAPADDANASLAFPWDGEAQGKTDTFGRSLVGVPDPYRPDFATIPDPDAAHQRLAADMRARRELAWASAFKALEPVPLLGLANQLQARPSCPDGVALKDIDRCAREADEAGCAAYESNGVGDICGWNADAGVCAPACDLLAVGDDEIPRIPRWQTWYGLEDINRVFKEAYAQLDPDEQIAHAPLSDLVIGRALQANHTEIERSSRWPLWRYTKAVADLDDCALTQGEDEDDEDFADRCAEQRMSQFSGAAAAGGGIARMMYSPAFVLHMMRNYPQILDCQDDTLVSSWCADGELCEDPETNNFSTCFLAEFPMDAGRPWEALDPAEAGDVAGLPDMGGTVLIKATWSRVGFGFELPAFDTDADALSARIAQGANADWGEQGDRTYGEGFPGPDDIYTIETRTGSVYRLTGLHIMTKELRHWVWITLWWSDKPDEDFGADRPDSFERLPGVWSNYKMCVVVDYMELDPDAPGRFADHPTLQAALAATNPIQGAPSWCSNPYIEHGAGNARTNCIGCHQHAGSRVGEDGSSPFELEAIIAHEGLVPDVVNRFPGNGRVRRRASFATDYSWAFSRLDDLTELMRSEVEFRGAQDARWLRVKNILAAQGDATRGEDVFRNATPDQTCTDCHGQNGEGDIGPNLEAVFATKTEWQIMSTIIEGRDPMPMWGDRLTDEQLADLMVYLRASFAPAD